jgi:hypothetical protein
MKTGALANFSKAFLRNNNSTKTCHHFGTPVGGEKFFDCVSGGRPSIEK